MCDAIHDFADDLRAAESCLQAISLHSELGHWSFKRPALLPGAPGIEPGTPGVGEAPPKAHKRSTQGILSVSVGH